MEHLRVPAVLLNCLAARTQEPWRILRDVLAGGRLGMSTSISSRADLHAVLDKCPHGATISLKARRGVLETSIFAAEWVLHSDGERTKFCPSHVFDTSVHNVFDRPLCRMEESSHLPLDLIPPELIVENVEWEGGRWTFYCQGMPLLTDPEAPVRFPISESYR